ncbi:MAG: porin family protein [Bradyrhizobium sp.]|jgi:outer membrane immunogenic protein|nr:porin family protein [Bradyrhizobium sp.]MEA2865417.1 outer rane immunogenic protein [Bradyrhizobium sp.]
MKKLLLGATVLLALGVAPALAADMAMKAAPVALPYNWNGWYVGLNAGAAINDSRYDLDPAGCFLTGCGAGGIPGNAFRQFSTKLNGTDFTGGGQVGYNYHFTPLWVAGLETDFNYNGLRQSDAVTQALGAPLFAPSTFVHTVTSSLDWFGTVRGRVGFLATPNLLLYGTGGLAYGQVRSSSVAVFPPPGLVDTYAGSTSTVRVGWTAGAGAEWLVSGSWSVKAEYLYLDLGHADYADACISPAGVCGVAAPPAYQTSVTTREHIARIGINYHFPRY